MLLSKYSHVYLRSRFNDFLCSKKYVKRILNEGLPNPYNLQEKGDLIIHFDGLTQQTH